MSTRDRKRRDAASHSVDAARADAPGPARATPPAAARLADTPRMATQRQQLQAAFGPALQRQASDDEEPLQMRTRRTEPPTPKPLQQPPDDAPEALRTQQPPATVQRAAAGAGADGLPTELRAGIEALSGMPMDGVRVHRDSTLPATMQALAYAQGSDIHLGPGQAHHLPHEAWHVVQQAQGRVPATSQLAGGTALNDDAVLEDEATRMGEAAQRLGAGAAAAAGAATQARQAAAGEPAQRVAVRQARAAPAARHVAGTGVVQRVLALHGTAWNTVTHITSSAGGVGGVLFMSDGSSRLVVKPNTHADEELIAERVHGTLSAPPRDGLLAGRPWQVRPLARRFASNADQAAIGLLAAGAAPDGTARTMNLLHDVANTPPGGTMIMESAPAQARGYDRLLEEQKAAHHIETGAERSGPSRQDRVKDRSGLKPLVNDDSYAYALGQLAGTDIVLGNFDRLAYASNLGNMLVDPESRTIHPIDNVDPNSRVRFGQHPGAAGPVTLADWLGNHYARLYTQGMWQALFDLIWKRSEHSSMSLRDDLLSHVLPEEQPLVERKLDRHVEDIGQHFIAGLKQSKADLLRAGPLPPVALPGKWSVQAAQLYNARLAALGP